MGRFPRTISEYKLNYENRVVAIEKADTIRKLVVERGEAEWWFYNGYILAKQKFALQELIIEKLEGLTNERI